jgi:hypothetical protein
MNQSDRYSAPMLDVDLADVSAAEGQPATVDPALSNASAAGESAEAPPGQDTAEIGYRGTTAHTVAGITYRQLDYWARTGLVVPSVPWISRNGPLRAIAKTPCPPWRRSTISSADRHS